MWMDMESAFAMMNGNDDAVVAIAEKQPFVFYRKNMPESVRLLIESLGGKIKMNPDHGHWDVTFES